MNTNLVFSTIFSIFEHMAKIIITEKELEKMVKESVEQVLKEGCLPLNYAETYVVPEPLVEMARINKKESGNSIFPFESWEVKIWSNGHIPPHFHILKDGWNVSFKIEDGSVLQIEGEGKNKDIYNYMVANTADWLNQPCAALPKISNKENAILQWEQLHDND